MDGRSIWICGILLHIAASVLGQVPALPRINMDSPHTAFPRNVTSAIPVGTPFESAKSILHASGFKPWGKNWIDPETGLNAHHVRFSTYRGLVRTDYAVTLYADGIGVRKVETDTFYTGP